MKRTGHDHVFFGANFAAWQPFDLHWPTRMAEQYPNFPADETLRETFSRIAQQPRAPTLTELGQLEDELRAAVAAWKGTGALPEQMIDRLRRTATDCGVTSSGNQLFEYMVRWCVDQYYTPNRS